MTGLIITITRFYLLTVLVLNAINGVIAIVEGRKIEAYILIQLAVLCAVVLTPHEIRIKVKTEKKEPHE